MPPLTTLATGPKNRETSPLSNPPSSFEHSMNMVLTPPTRPRNSLGVRSCTSTCRITTLTLSAAPPSANAAPAIHGSLARPNPIMANANAATLLTSDHDENDKPFVIGSRTAEGFYNVRAGLDQAISRGLAYAPYADLIWCETAKPDLEEAKIFAEAIRKQYPDQLLAYNCSPSFNWKKNLDDATIAKFQRELGAMGYKYQFITLAGIHSMWYNMFELAYGYARNGMTSYVELQEKEFAAASRGYTFVSHQQEVGTGYFDQVTTCIQGGNSSVTALTGSTEEEQFTVVSSP